MNIEIDIDYWTLCIIKRIISLERSEKLAFDFTIKDTRIEVASYCRWEVSIWKVWWMICRRCGRFPSINRVRNAFRYLTHTFVTFFSTWIKALHLCVVLLQHLTAGSMTFLTGAAKANILLVHPDTYTIFPREDGGSNFLSRRLSRENRVFPLELFLTAASLEFSCQGKCRCFEWIFREGKIRSMGLGAVSLQINKSQVDWKDFILFTSSTKQ